MLNLLLGVIFANFSFVEQSNQFKDLNQNQIEWIGIQKKILKISPLSYSPPKTGIRSKILRLLRGKKYKKFLLLTLFVNVVALGLRHDGESGNFKTILQTILNIVTFCYFLEFLMKISCYGLLSYLKTKIFIFEFFILFGYVLEFLLLYFFNETLSLIQVNLLMILIKCIKLLSIIRFFFYLKALKRIIRNLGYSLKMLSNLLYLILIVFFLYSTIGNYLFREVDNGVIIRDRINFKNILSSMMILFKCMTCDNWTDIMYDVINGKCDFCGEGILFIK